ncbi:hypothetical protein JJC00_01670 [Bradyrhizobium diazoefficiens]|uniref:hypothetical protein n=1 Tax=Bradyrhizobium diazoefficiens TaxID=1355477 RepID=UPI00190A39DA|nr:hypothetical protein [Bradyrhizobium diazoefficiens]QQO34450.1 hypothetical protein JJC00_01670 [Bradyrhizobium diazoefficiens]
MSMIPIITDAEQHDQRDGYDLSGIMTLAELIGYLVAVSRERSWDEVAVVERFVMEAKPHREWVEEAEPLLRALGYVAVADHLRKLRRGLKAKPPSRSQRK